MNIIHGFYSHPLYRIWRAMLSRCENTNNISYKNYGGRGITVCATWHSFENWYAAVGNRPSSKHQLDRIDNDGNYEPGNIRWGTKKEQANNCRSNCIIKFQGQRKTIAEWADIIGIKQSTLYARLDKLRWPIEKALTKTVRMKNGKNSLSKP